MAGCPDRALVADPWNVGAVLIVVVVAMAMSSLCPAAESIGGLLACRRLTDSTARLACFDREAALLDSGPAPRAAASAGALSTPQASAAPAVAPTPAPPATSAPLAAVAQSAPGPSPLPPARPTTSAPLDPEQQFGLPEHAVAAREVAAGTRAAEAAKIEAHLVSLGPAADGRWVFTLDNRQVWRELASEGDLLAKPGDAVTISRAFLGSYWLQAPTGRGCKVTRIR
jgi:hypothetical protein